MQHATVAEEPGSGAPATGTPDAATSNAFVINLMSSTTPVALTRPDHAGLKRFTFFVSRRREDGRERFRLHMGYFDSQPEAEQLLDIVRAIYPGAWVGLAPGRRLTAAAPASPAASEALPAPAAQPSALPVDSAPDVDAPRVEPSVTALTLVPDAGRAPPVDVTESARNASAAPAAKEDVREATRSMSNVREAIASLADGGAGPRSRVAPVDLSERSIPELQAAVIPTVRPAQPSELTNTATLRLLETGRPARDTGTVAEPAASQPQASAVPPTVIQRVADTVVQRVQTGDSQGVPTEKTWYAVQLLWSVQPIDLTQIPELAIFSAYTLYGAEGNREGRRWYGLRLGFFTDAVSAKQVAHYVRSDFATVSVVPVTDREREQARMALTLAGSSAEQANEQQAGKRAARTSAAGRAAAPSRATPTHTGAARARSGGKGELAAGSGAATAAAQVAEFKFIDDVPASTTAGAVPEEAKRAAPAKASQSVPAAGRPGAARAARGAPGKRAKARPAGQIQGRARAKPKTLEETLEILGANTLQVENESGPSINDSGVRHMRIEVAKGKPSRLSRLFERLSERRG